MGTGKPPKYEPLRRYLAAQSGETITLTFPEIEAILGAPLPGSARETGWWANVRGQQRPQSWAWQQPGWCVAGTQLRSVSRSVTFVRRWVSSVDSDASVEP